MYDHGSMPVPWIDITPISLALKGEKEHIFSTKFISQTAFMHLSLTQNNSTKYTGTCACCSESLIAVIVITYIYMYTQLDYIPSSGQRSN